MQDHSNLTVWTGPAKAVKTARQRWLNEMEAEQLRSQNYAAKMLLLKAQIHPHFLFNSLNNIYFLLQTGSPEAPEVIWKMKSLLHFVLKQGEAEKVPLETEIAAIRAYIGLERIRFADDIFLHMDINIGAGDQVIAPMLLLPFVENAFKHGTNKVTNRPWIKLTIRVEQDRLRFQLSNSSLDLSTFMEKNGGIGLKNVKARLRLLYPGRHGIHLSKGEGQFSVDLHIRLHQASEPVAVPGIMESAVGKKQLKYWRRKPSELERLEKQNAETALLLLTGRLCPDFMLETLNQIQKAAMKGSAQAQSLLMKFSALLSYFIYESDRDMVPMEREVSVMLDYLYMKNLSSASTCECKVRKIGNMENRYLPPFLILPIIDLYFRVSSTLPEHRWLDLEIGMQGDRFMLRLIHGKPPGCRADTFSLHPDILNLQKRLDILYRGNHQFKLVLKEEMIIVSLAINSGNGLDCEMPVRLKRKGATLQRETKTAT